jgi:DNA-binding NarL/FixJ family response regulator
MAGTLKVVIVDDHKTFAELFARALEQEPGVTCVGTATTAEEAHVMVRVLDPDVVVMDVQLGSADGIELTRELVEATPELRVVVLTAHAGGDLMHRAAAAGACSLLPKDGSLDEVLGTLRTARTGGFTVHPRLLKVLMEQREVPRCDSTQLTDREAEVLRALGAGHSVRQIARLLTISEHTARGHVKRVLTKLDAHTQLEAVATAHRRGLLG